MILLPTTRERLIISRAPNIGVISLLVCNLPKHWWPVVVVVLVVVGVHLTSVSPGLWHLTHLPWWSAASGPGSQADWRLRWFYSSSRLETSLCWVRRRQSGVVNAQISISRQRWRIFKSASHGLWLWWYPGLTIPTYSRYKGWSSKTSWIMFTNLL